MKYLLLYLLIACSVSAISQTNTILPVGTYRGGICEDDGICGLWYIKKDSGFVFAQFNNDGFLNSYGAGKWTLMADSIITFTFTNSLQPLVQQVHTIIEGKTATPTDSVFITGQLISESKPVGFAVVTMGKRGTSADANGNFTIKGKRGKGSISLGMFAAPSGIFPTFIELPSMNNVYKITVELPKEQASSCIPVYQQMMMLNQDPAFKFHVSLSHKQLSLGINLMEKGNAAMVDRLRNAALKQPLLAAGIAELVNLIEAP